MAVRVALADDSFLALEALVALLGTAPEVELVAVCRDGDALRQAVEETLPDVVVTDLRMPPSMAAEGLHVALELGVTHPEMGVVLLSAYAEPEYALALLEPGSQGRGYLLKERIHGARQLITTIESVSRGGSVVDPNLVSALVCGNTDGDRTDPWALTTREDDILAQMAGGASNAAIAARLGLTKRSVEKDVGSIFAKLELAATPDVSRRVQAVLRFLAQRGRASGDRSRRPRQGTAARP